MCTQIYVISHIHNLSLCHKEMTIFKADCNTIKSDIEGPKCLSDELTSQSLMRRKGEKEMEKTVKYKVLILGDTKNAVSNFRCLCTNTTR